MKSTDRRVLAFIDYLRESCREGKTRIILKNLKSIPDWDGEFVDGLDGYFNPPKKKTIGTIVIAANRPLPTVLHTLAHEYVHYLQWKAKNKYYNTVSYHQLEKKTEARA
jgi:Zn-dependent peptidase ImmA (M78 family)